MYLPPSTVSYNGKALQHQFPDTYRNKLVQVNFKSGTIGTRPVAPIRLRKLKSLPDGKLNMVAIWHVKPKHPFKSFNYPSFVFTEGLQ